MYLKPDNPPSRILNGLYYDPYQEKLFLVAAPLLRMYFYSCDIHKLINIYIYIYNRVCKHRVAYIFSLTSFCVRHQDKSAEVCTDVPCTWNKPSRITLPSEITCMDTRIYQPCPTPEFHFEDYSKGLLQPLQRYKCFSSSNIVW